MKALRACGDSGPSLRFVAGALALLTVGLLLVWGLHLEADSAEAQTPYVEKECGHVSASIRNLRTFGYNGHRPLRCRTGRRVSRRWVVVGCSRRPGDECRFAYLRRRWICVVGTLKGKRVIGCNNGRTVGLSFFYR